MYMYIYNIRTQLQTAQHLGPGTYFANDLEEKRWDIYM